MNRRGYWVAASACLITVMLFTLFSWYAVGLVDLQKCKQLTATWMDQIEAEIDERTEEQRLALANTKEEQLSKTRVLSMLISASPSSLESEAALEELRIAVGAELISISDETGKICYSTDLFSEGQFVRREFLPAAESQVFQQAVTEIRGETLSVIAGVSRLDAAGVVQATYSSSNLSQLIEALDISGITPSYPVLVDGIAAVIDRESGCYISHTNSVQIGMPSQYDAARFRGDTGHFSSALNGQRAIVWYRTAQDKVLLCVVPTHEVYARRNLVVTWLAVFSVIATALVLLILRNFALHHLSRNSDPHTHA